MKNIFRNDNVEDLMGWRGRVGLILPSSTIIMEPWFNRLKPRGVTFLGSRMFISGVTPKELIEMEKYSLRAAKELASAEVNLIAYCCTSGSFIKGKGFDKLIIEKIEKETGIKTLTTTTAVLKALEKLGLKKIVLVTPYIKEINISEKKFLESNGYKVVRMAGMNIKTGTGLADPCPGEIYNFAKRNWSEEADGIFISCMSFRSPDIVEALEVDIGKPVVCAIQATLWNILGEIEVFDPIEGYGSLLREIKYEK